MLITLVTTQRWALSKNKKGSVLENRGEHWSIVITKKQTQRSQLCNNVHLRFPGPILFYLTPLFHLTKHSPSLRLASSSNPRPSFFQVHATWRRFAWQLSTKKQLYTTKLLCWKGYVGFLFCFCWLCISNYAENPNPKPPSYSWLNYISPLYQGNTLSLTIAIVSLVKFLTARKMTSCPNNSAWRSDWKNPDLNYSFFWSYFWHVNNK